MRACLVLFVLFIATRAEAIPSFARKYEAPCGMCHAPAYPALNAVGTRFKLNGYQLDGAGEEAYARRFPNPDERLEILPMPALALRAQGSVAAALDPDHAGENPLDLRPLQNLFLLAGASIYPNVSFFAAATLAPEPGLHHGAVGVHNLFGPDWLNLRFGRLLLLDFARPEHRTLTAYGNPIATTRVGLNPTVLDSTQHGVDLYGRLFERRLFYRIAVVQGAQGEDGIRDLDAHKDVLLELHGQPHHLFTLGVLGYRGKTQITDQAGGVRVRFTDGFFIAAAMAELDLPWVNVFGQVVYNTHDNPSGDGEHGDHWGYRGELRAHLGRGLHFVGRYDQLVSHHGGAFKHATVHVGWLALTNLRLAFESSIPLERVEASTAFALVDVAF